MSNLQLIERLCGLVEQQAETITALSMALAEAGAYSEALEQMAEATRREYRDLLGEQEAT